MATKPIVTPTSRGWHTGVVMTAKQGARLAKAGKGKAESKPTDYKPGTTGQQEFYSSYKKITELQHLKELKALDDNDYGV